jgi:voltage-gated potassium channel Kch
VLVLGWNSGAHAVLRELDNFAVRGSELLVVSEMGVPDVRKPRNFTAWVREGQTTDRATLDSLDIASFDQVIVLCYSDDLDVQRADARTLITLLHLREILATDPGARRPAVVSEMLDDRNRALAEIAEVDDVIVSDEIVSLILAQLSEDARLELVFRDLLDAGGSEIYLRPVEEYVRTGGELTFATIVHAAAERGETAIGYRTLAQSRNAAAGHGVRVNPAKSMLVCPVPGDRIIVLAEQ